MHTLAFAESIQLFPDGTLFIHVALILIMIWVLNRTLFRPVNRVLESRAQKTGGRSTEAQEILKSVSEKQLRYDEAMREARGEGYELIERERANAVAERQTKVGALKEEVAQLVAQESQELESQTVTARSAIAADAEKLADRITSSILR